MTDTALVVPAAETTLPGPKPRVRVRAGSALSARSAYMTSKARAAAPYDAVGQGPRSPVNGDYGPNVNIDFLDRLRRDARQLMRTSGFAYNGMRKRTGHVVGTGIQPTVPFPDLQELWDVWTDHSDFFGRLTFYGQQVALHSAEGVNGEGFGRIHDIEPDPENLPGIVPLRVELIEGDRVPTHFTRPAPTAGRAIVASIEVDDRMRPQGFWCYRHHPLDVWAFAGARTFEMERVDGADAIHMFWPERDGALRGTPLLARPGPKLRDHAEYHDAELTRKKTTALFGGYVHTPAEDDGAVSPGAGMAGTGVYGDHDGDGDLDIQAVEPGSFVKLPPGYQVTFSKPEDVGANFGVYDRAAVSQFSAGMLLLPEQVTNDFGGMASDRVWRAAATDLVPLVEQEQWLKVVPMVCEKVWRRFVASAILHRMWTPPADAKPNQWLVPTWTPPVLKHTHALQEIKALAAAEALGVTSKVRIAGALGNNLAAITAEREAQRKSEIEAGLLVEEENAPSAEPVAAEAVSIQAIEAAVERVLEAHGLLQ